MNNNPKIEELFGILDQIVNNYSNYLAISPAEILQKYTNHVLKKTNTVPMNTEELQEEDQKEASIDDNDGPTGNSDIDEMPVEEQKSNEPVDDVEGPIGSSDVDQLPEKEQKENSTMNDVDSPTGTPGVDTTIDPEVSTNAITSKHGSLVSSAFGRNNRVRRQSGKAFSTIPTEASTDDVSLPSSSTPSTSNAIPTSIASSSSSAVKRDRKRKEDDTMAQGRSKKSKNCTSSAESEGYSCCTLTTEELRYIEANRDCDGKEGCRIKRQAQYWMYEGKSYCEECHPRFTEGKDKKDINILNNTNERSEQKYKCVQCGKMEHAICANFLGDFGKFCCKSCQKEEPIGVVDGLPKNALDEFITKKVNEFFDEVTGSRYPENKITILNIHSSDSKVSVKDIAPPDELKHFKNSWNSKKEIPFTERTILAFQRQQGADVIFFMLRTQEYANHQGKNWVTLEYMDSNPHFVPDTMKSKVICQITIAYFEYMKIMGFNRAHFWAKAAVEGDNYLFNVHPYSQRFLGQKTLVEWYGKLLKRGKEAGVIHDFRTFKEEKDQAPIKSLLDLPLFKDNLWTTMINWSVWNVRMNVMTFEESMNTYYEEHAEDNFFIDFFPKSDEPTAKPTTIPTRKVRLFSTRKLFSDWCCTQSLEFSTLRRTQYTSMRVIGMLNKSFKLPTTIKK